MNTTDLKERKDRINFLQKKMYLNMSTVFLKRLFCIFFRFETGDVPLLVAIAGTHSPHLSLGIV